MPMPLLIPALAGAALLLAATSSGAKKPAGLPQPPAPPKPPAQPVLPASVQTELAKALASMDPNKMMAYANEVAKKYPYAADQLRKAAGQIALYGKPTAPVVFTPPAPAQAPVYVAPVAPPAAGRATLRQGSRGVDVVAWQKILGIPADGIFGPKTTLATKAWQKARGLTADGVVGPRTWAAAGAAASAGPSASDDSTIRAQIYKATDPAALDNLASVLASKPGYETLASLASSRAAELRAMQATATGVQAVQQILSAPSPVQPLIKKGSTGAAVKTWQGILGVTQDGIFGSVTDSKTRAWQSAHGLTADGIVGPATWAAAALPAPTAAPLPPPVITVAPVEAPAAAAATPMTDLQLKTAATATYIKGARKTSADTMMIKNWQTAAGLPSADGKFGPASAERMAEIGVSDLPIVWYWPATNAAARVALYKSRLNELASHADAEGNTARAAALRASAARDNGQSKQIGE